MNNSYYAFTMKCLNIHQRLNLKQLLQNRGVLFQHYCLINVGCTVGLDGKTYIALPGIYNSVIEFPGDINDGSVRHFKNL